MHQKVERVTSKAISNWLARNLNTGEDNLGLATTPVVAQQTILHDAEHASHLVLPVIPIP